MKRIIIFSFVFLFAAVFTVQAQSRNGKGESLAQEFMRRQRAEDEAETKKDTAALERIFADDFVFIAANGAIYDKKKFLDEIKADTETGAPQTLAYEDFKVRVYGKTAIVNYLLTVCGKDAGGKDFMNRYRQSVVWIKHKNDWRITNFHSTRLRQ
ncbi:MAG: nuclear transport factor 2 family protein [Acidobacteriota bacterium]|nr:nuclear transport factor 2 family protein [Acidobacteriota bacterium]